MPITGQAKGLENASELIGDLESMAEYWERWGSRQLDSAKTARAARKAAECRSLARVMRQELIEKLDGR